MGSFRYCRRCGYDFDDAAPDPLQRRPGTPGWTGWREDPRGDEGDGEVAATDEAWPIVAVGIALTAAMAVFVVVFLLATLFDGQG